MLDVRLVLDLVDSEGRRRAEKTASLPGVPCKGDFIDTIAQPTLALAATTVRWQAAEGTVTVFLGLGDTPRPGITDHGGELELADYMVEDLRKAGWDIGGYE